jgi:hypothetical protein
MNPKESGQGVTQKPRRRRRFIYSLVFILLFLLIVLVSAFLGFNYYGEQILKEHIRKKIGQSSHGLYSIDFRTLNLNILTGKLQIDSFELIPDTMLYKKLVETGNIRSALYRVSVASVVVDRIRFWHLFSERRVNFRQLLIEVPRFNIAAFPDTVKAKKNKWRVVYEDVYPLVSDVFKDFHIDSVKVKKGIFLSSFRQKTGKTVTGEYEFSATLRDVSVNPFSYFNKQRVFYSKDIELIIYNFDYALADSMYFLRAGELGFSLNRSYLFGKKLSLKPNFQSRELQKSHAGDFFQIDLPAFSIEGVNLFKAMMERKVDISEVNLEDLKVKIFRNHHDGLAVPLKKKKRNVKIDNLYSVIAKELHYIDVGSLKIGDASLDFFAHVPDRKPELSIGQVDLSFTNFRLDQGSGHDPERLFYSRQVELDLGNFALSLRDSIHTFRTGSVYISSQKSLIKVGTSMLTPDTGRNSQVLNGRQNTMFLFLPGLTFTGIDLKRLFNRRALTFDRLTIDAPDVQYTRYHISKNPDPRFQKPGDFFVEENEDFFYRLLKKYLWSIQAGEIAIQQGRFEYASGIGGNAVPVARALFTLTMYDFLVDSARGMNRQGYFYSSDFDLKLMAMSFASADSLKFFMADSIRIKTMDSIIEAHHLQILKRAGQSESENGQGGRHALTIGFSMDKLTLFGLNHRKWFLEKNLKANTVVADHPVLNLKSENPAGNRTREVKVDFNPAGDYIRSFDFRTFIVKKGRFAYNGLNDRRAAEFLLNDIDFSISNAWIRLPREGNDSGVIRFDSVSLSFLPFRAVLADSSYDLTVKKVTVHSYPATINIEGFSIHPMGQRHDSTSHSLFTADVPGITISGFYFDKAIFNHTWQVDRIEVENPSLMIKGKKNESPGEKQSFDPVSLIRIPPYMNSLRVDRCMIRNANLTLQNGEGSGENMTSVRDFTLEIDGFHYDSLARSGSGDTPLFFSRNVSLTVPGFSRISSDSMYRMSFKRFGLTTRPPEAWIDSAEIVPIYDRIQFSLKKGYQSDRMVVFLKRIGIGQPDYKHLLRNHEIVARSMTIEGLRLESYRDKRLPFDKFQYKLMPQATVSKIRFPLKFDTVQLKDGFAVYEEQTGETPGMVFFDGVNARITGFNTIKPEETENGKIAAIDLYGNGKLMGKSTLETSIRLFMNHPRDSFIVRGTIGLLELRDINPMLSRLMPVSVRSGISQGTEIWNIYANDSVARGSVDFRYSNLAINLQSNKTGFWDQAGEVLLTEIVNLLLPSANPGEGEKVRTGIVYFERDPGKGFINFIWKSVQSGIRSSVGFNTKIQREIRKKEKKK